MFAGIDAGSVSVKLTLLNEAGMVVRQAYHRHGGRPLIVARALIGDLMAAYPNLRLACTGSAGKRLAEGLGCPHVNELSAMAAAAARLIPAAGCIIEMGGEDAKLIILDTAPGKPHGAIADFSLNSVCAAGTGSFLDQQAERMRLSIEDFAALALTSATPPRIAGRCSVFAKSDMIHLQQIGTPLEDIVAGLCFAVARNFLGAIVRGRPLPENIAFLGGVALNAGVLRAFRAVFGRDDITIPEDPTQYGAYGAILRAMADGGAATPDMAGLDASMALWSAEADQGRRTPLVQPGDDFLSRHPITHADPDQSPVLPQSGTGSHEPTPLYLGVDIGSISTNLAVIDGSGSLIARRYLRTSSRPIEAVRQGLAQIHAELDLLSWPWVIAGVGTTGSGRYMVADFIGADVVKNEITAQATAAAFIDPQVDTIFEIGGQDSKFISLKDGIIVDFEMNKACAAGTGSFLEEQAEKLSVSIKGEFADRALGSDNPCRLGERCTVFMENSLQAGLTDGRRKADLLAGLAYSIVENYMGRVVCGRPVGQHIFFQGGTAFNTAVVAAFEKYLGRPVVVPPHHDVTGAIGMALIARGHMQRHGGSSAFGGFDLAETGYKLTSFACKGCDNLCEINQVSIDGRTDRLHYGGRCEKWDMRRTKGAELPDLFGFRHQALMHSHEERRAAAENSGPPRRGPIGLPLVFFMHDQLPFYATLLWELGFEPVVSPLTTPAIARLGVEKVLADTCYPIKAAQGHVRWLAQQGLTTQFLPSFIDLSSPGGAYPTSLACPLTQAFPYQIRTAFPELTIVAPELNMRYGSKALRKALTKAFEGYGVGRAELEKAIAAAHAAQDLFHSTIQAKGRQVLGDMASNGRRALVVVGRAYNAFDMGMNLEIPRKLATLDEYCLPMDFLPTDAAVDRAVHACWPQLYWRSGQRILSAVAQIKKLPGLYPLFIGSFSCGPDSFILKYFDEELRGHPSLHIEIDEHSADAGVITRMEAFLDSLTAMKGLEDASAVAACASTRQASPETAVQTAQQRVARRGRMRGVTVHVPRMGDQALGLVAAFRAAGLEAQPLPEPTPQSVALAHGYISGKECYPCAVTTGDMLQACQKPGFNPRGNAFFMPSGRGPCRFGQYNVFHRMVLDKAGFGEVAIFSPEQSEVMYEEFGVVGPEFSRRSWEGIVSIGLLLKCLHEIRPQEAVPGKTKTLYDHSLSRLVETLSAGQAPDPVLREARQAFEEMPRHRQHRPLIGIVGEIFVRSQPFSNERLVEAVEAHGGRAWLATCDEWIYYVNEVSRRRAWRLRDIRRVLSLSITNLVQTRAAHRLERIFHGLLPTAHEASIAELLSLAAPYLQPSFEGEAILSVGKAVDMCRKGCSGIINAMPFGCMPGTISAALLGAVGKRFGVPIINLAFDGTPSQTTSLTLETFMEQARNRSHPS